MNLNKNNNIFALVDCNNFYVSCERVFRPELKSKPVIVLSNNDGCIVARSEEAKLLGIPMAAPYYKYKHIVLKHNIEVFSSNYQLYADMSDRVMQSLRHFVPEIEIYSIDEAFLKLDSFALHDISILCQAIRDKTYQWTGIPISIGIAPTKTLAKIANNIAKKTTLTGVANLCNESVQTKIMREFPVQSLWGVSTNWGKILQQLGINSALELSKANSKFIRTHLNVTVEKIVMELRGISCLQLQAVAARKSIMSSKSFSKVTSSKTNIEAALASYCETACSKLRAQSGKAQAVTVFITTNRYQKNNLKYSNSATAALTNANADSSYLLKQAKNLLQSIYIPDYQYHKCGIILLDIIPENLSQRSFLPYPEEHAGKSIMAIVDRINNKIGANSICLAASIPAKKLQLSPRKRSPRYTTNWHDIPVVK